MLSTEPPPQHPLQARLGARFSPGSREMLSTGPGLPHTETSIGCSSALPGSGRDQGSNTVSPVPPTRSLPGPTWPEPGRENTAQAQDLGLLWLNQLQAEAPSYKQVQTVGTDAQAESASPPTEFSPFGFRGCRASMRDTPTGSNRNVPLGCGVHVFTLKSFRLARTSP